MAEAIHIGLIDDDAAVLHSLRLYFSRRNVETTCFAAAKAFLGALARPAPFDCIVSEVRMPGLSGLDLVRELRMRNATAPIILITGRGDIDMAVNAIKLGAYDFIEKPFDESRLLSSIQTAVETRRQKARDALELLQSRFKLLSVRQRQVMELAVAGFSNKEIGTKLNINPKTVEKHRAWVMERVGAKNLAELVRMAMQIEGKS